MTGPELATRARLVDASAAQVRAAIRAGRWTGPTAGLARGYAQANLVILPAADAEDFAEFCRLNAQACPLLEQLPAGDPRPHHAAADADLRTDVPRYRVFHNGLPAPAEPTAIGDLWRDDFVAFLLGCSFSFENALLAAGLEVRHLSQGCNVPMYRTARDCHTAGRFAGPLVVSMRPFAREHVDRVVEITAAFPAMHGAPVHAGDPAALGIADISRPEFGDAVTVHPHEVPVFWACGVTPQLALSESGCELAITHSPGCMFVTDWRDDHLGR